MNQPAIFPPGTRSYVDTVSNRAEVWLKEKDQEEREIIRWLRCSITGMIEQCEHGCIAPVNVQHCVQELRTGFLNKLRSLFSSTVPEYPLYIPTASGILGDEFATMPQTTREKKHLVWGDVTLANHPEFEQISKFGEFSLVTILKRLTPLQEEMAGVAERVIAAIREYGSIVGDFNTIGADRICICLKQNHGSLQHLEIFFRYPAKLQIWFQHQRTLIKLREIISENVDKKRMRLFLEALTLREDTKSQSHSLELLLANESACINAEKDPIEAQMIIQRLLALSQNSRVDAESFLSSLTATQRSETMEIALDPSFSERVHGLSYKNRNEYGRASAEQDKIGNIESVKKIVKKDFQKMHPYILSQVNKYLPPGECGIIILGGDHFESGYNFERDSMYANNDPFSLMDVSLEKYIEDEPAKNVRFIIVEPVDYQSTLQ